MGYQDPSGTDDAADSSAAAGTAPGRSGSGPAPPCGPSPASAPRQALPGEHDQASASRRDGSGEHASEVGAAEQALAARPADRAGAGGQAAPGEPDLAGSPRQRSQGGSSDSEQAGSSWQDLLRGLGATGAAIWARSSSEPLGCRRGLPILDGNAVSSCPPGARAGDMGAHLLPAHSSCSDPGRGPAKSPGDAEQAGRTGPRGISKLSEGAAANLGGASGLPDMTDSPRAPPEQVPSFGGIAAGHAARAAVMEVNPDANPPPALLAARAGVSTVSSGNTVGEAAELWVNRGIERAERGGHTAGGSGGGGIGGRGGGTEPRAQVRADPVEEGASGSGLTSGGGGGRARRAGLPAAAAALETFADKLVRHADELQPRSRQVCPVF